MQLKDRSDREVSVSIEVAETANYVFICGCPRSGTSAMTQLLSAHSQIVIGIERFKYINKNLLRPEMFRKDYFFRSIPSETNILPDSEEYAATIRPWKKNTIVRKLLVINFRRITIFMKNSRKYL